MPCARSRRFQKSQSFACLALVVVLSSAENARAQQPGAMIRQAKLTANDAQAQSNFGFDVAISGDTAIVASSNHAAYIYVREQGT